MFGSFQPELHKPTYGLTVPVTTYNLLRLQYGEYGNMISDVRQADRFRDKLGHIFGPPGWKPQHATSTDTAPTTEVSA